jgi:hypothetical protein
MTPEANKHKILASIERRILVAEEHGLRHTAKSWREAYQMIAEKPAAELILAMRPEQRQE